MNFLKFYIALVLGGDLSSHTENCENKNSGEQGICTSLWFCVEVAKGVNIGTCRKEQSEDICCKIKRFDATHQSFAISNISNQETDAGLPSNLLKTDFSSEQISVKSAKQTSDGEPDSTSGNISGLPEVHGSPVLVEETHNMRKPVELAEDFDNRLPVRIQESHDLRWPVLEEDTHDLRNTLTDDYEFSTESDLVEKQSRKKTSESLENRNFSNFYEYLASQDAFKEYEEKDELNKKCLDIFRESNKNKTLKYKEQEEKFQKNELLSSASEVCGTSYSRTTPKLVGGKESNYLQWPWMVSLRKRRYDRFWHKCGAALLNRLWVITVAHCVEFLPPWDVSLRLGSYNLKREDELHSYIIRTVDKIIIHPQFNTNTFDNDVALLLMSSPVEFRPNISPICLPKKIQEIEGKTAIVLGWGRKPETRSASAALNELLLPVMSNKECEEMYSIAGMKEKILDGFFCAGTAEGGSDTCDGDSGGPMSLVDSDRKWALIGLVSWGGICGAPNQPGVYTRIKSYVEWIEGTMACYKY